MRSVRELLLKMSSQGITATKREVDDLHKSNKDLTALFPKMRTAAVAAYGAIAGALAAGGATAAVYKFGKALVDTGADLEKQQIRLETVMKSSERAQQRLAYLIDFSRKSHFEVPGLVDATIQLEAMGLNAERILPVISDAASIAGKDIGTASMAILSALSGQVRALKEFGINTLQVEAELGGKIARGTAKDQEEIITTVLDLLEKKFAGGTARLEQSWGGMLGDFGDTWYSLRAKIAQGGLFDATRADLKSVRDELNEFVERGGLDAIALGFNNAWHTIHETFFAPLFENIGGADTDMRLLALSVERWTLEIARGATVAAIPLQALLPMLAFIRDLTSEGDLIYTKEAWRIANQNIDSAAGKIGELDKRIKELNAISAGVSAPANLSAFSVAADAAAQRGLDRIGRGAGQIGTGDTGIFSPGGRGGAGTGSPGGGGAGGLTGKGNILPSDQIWVDSLLSSIQVRADAEHAYKQSMFETNQEYNELMLESDLMQSEQGLEAAERYASARARVEQAGLWAQMKFRELYVGRQMKLEKAAAAFGISAIGEGSKFAIDAMLARAKVQAKFAAAEALVFAGYGNWAAAAKMGAAAVEFGALVGLGEVAKGWIDRGAEERVAAMSAPSMGGFDETGTSRGTRTTGGGVAKTQQAVQNFYIVINNNVAGDYNVNEGDLSDAEQIQALFDQGLVRV